MKVKDLTQEHVDKNFRILSDISCLPPHKAKYESIYSRKGQIGELIEVIPEDLVCGTRDLNSPNDCTVHGHSAEATFFFNVPHIYDSGSGHCRTYYADAEIELIEEYMVTVLTFSADHLPKTSSTPSEPSANAPNLKGNSNYDS